jgi:hypothetical protein
MASGYRLAPGASEQSGAYGTGVGYDTLPQTVTRTRG